MPEQEFEIYLSLLGRFLKLTPTQRNEIAEELRGHLELRLEDLSQQGFSKADAVRLALDEMGDAGELAQHFSKIAQHRRRRFIMRCTSGTAVALAAGFFLVTSFWPEDQAPNLALHAEGEAKATDAKTPSVPEKRPVIPVSWKTRVYQEEYQKEWEQILNKEFDFELEGLTLRAAINQIEVLVEKRIVTDRSATDALGDLSDCDVSIPRGSFKLRTALKLLLVPHDLTYSCEEGYMALLLQTEASVNPDFMKIKMYDCRDLVRKLLSPEAESVNSGSFSATLAELENLVMVHTGEWKQSGEGEGAVSSFHGLLIVQQTDETHFAIEKFLNALRQPCLAPTLTGTGRVGAAEAPPVSVVYSPSISVNSQGVKVTRMVPVSNVHPAPVSAPVFNADLPGTPGGDSAPKKASFARPVTEPKK